MTYSMRSRGICYFCFIIIIHISCGQLVLDSFELHTTFLSLSPPCSLETHSNDQLHRRAHTRITIWDLFFFYFFDVFILSPSTRSEQTKKSVHERPSEREYENDVWYKKKSVLARVRIYKPILCRQTIQIG